MPEAAELMMRNGGSMGVMPINRPSGGLL